jgi:uncharacterized membrane protein YcaP (DUF421 family)
MDKLFGIEGAELLIPTHSVLEMIVRGSLMYLALFVILRFVMRRQAGSIGIADILVIVVIADAAQNGFAKEYRSITEGVLLVLTIVFWDFVIDWLGYRYPALGRLLERRPVPIIQNGKVLRRNMRQEYVTDDELKSFLRRAGVDSVEAVKSAHIESDGEISIVKKGK